MTETPDIEKLKRWLDQEIERLTKEGASIANTKYVRESAMHKKYAFQEVKAELNDLHLK